MNFLGLICAITTFLNIWLGHVVVRFIEARVSTIRIPAAIFAIAGLMLITGALITSLIPVSAILGITGIIAFWDAFEFIRQERRVKRGYAPANPNNPRHKQILTEYPAASTIDWLKREPIGRRYSNDEIVAIRKAIK